MFTWFLIILLLVIPSVLVWRAKTSPVLRQRIESFLRAIGLLGAEDSLFDPHKPFTWMVQWMQWAAVPTAIMVVLPTSILLDAAVGLVLALIFFMFTKFFVSKFPSGPTSRN